MGFLTERKDVSKMLQSYSLQYVEKRTRLQIRMVREEYSLFRKISDFCFCGGTLAS